MYLQEALKKTGKARRPRWDNPDFVDYVYIDKNENLIRHYGDSELNFAEHYPVESMLDDNWLPYEEPKCEWCEREGMLRTTYEAEPSAKITDMITELYDNQIALLKQGCKEHGCGGGE